MGSIPSRLTTWAEYSHSVFRFPASTFTGPWEASFNVLTSVAQQPRSGNVYKRVQIGGGDTARRIEEETLTINRIVMYSTTWCGDCRRSKRVLDEHGARYEVVNIEATEEALSTMLELNGGSQSVPTIVMPDGTVLVEPSNSELTAKLDELAVA